MREKFSSLNFETRQEIERLAKDGLPMHKIALLIGFSKTTISSEFSRCGGKASYSAKMGQENADKRKQERYSSYRQGVLSSEEKNQIDLLQAEGKSVSEIRRITKITGSRIYNYIHRILRNKEAHEKIDSLQEQCDILFQLVKDLKKTIEKERK